MCRASICRVSMSSTWQDCSHVVLLILHLPRGVTLTPTAVHRWQPLSPDTRRPVQGESWYLGRAEYNISLCMAHEPIAIILIPNEYHQFRAWRKFICSNFIEEIHICSTTKDMEVWYFRFITCKDLLRCFPFETFIGSTIINMMLATDREQQWCQGRDLGG